MAKKTTPTTVYNGKFIQMKSRNGWEYASRTKATGIVGIVAVTDAGELLLIEQFRPPVNQTVIEIPAGLAGDTAGSETEALLVAARRELLEETGYTARRWKQLAVGVPSAGICDEVITLFLATGLKKTADAAGDESEDITTHLVPVAKVEAFIKRQQRKGKTVDLKVYAALNWAAQAGKASAAK
ncbi:MAG TPA: NUDIX hydrolase [Tepidisphaeraceae bacterium]|jgi:ADP-ribose pyrophosphatase|nr:NUDIX hydrolase [Tepidisphaeraceae bacterium]